MNLYEFMDSHMWFTVLLGPFVLIVLGGTMELLMKLWSRFLRAIMVMFRGWPPAHIDADGDWRPEEENME